MTEGFVLDLDLRKCEEGMSCEEYTLLIAASPPEKDLPPTVRVRKNQHYDACAYHRSDGFLQSMLGTPVTEELEKAAMEIVKKYSQ